jgi:hypothetical protein
MIALMITTLVLILIGRFLGYLAVRLLDWALGVNK